MSRERINVVSTAEGPGALLSNFAHTPFMLDGVSCASVEGFIQGLKEKGVEKQRRICLRHGFEAKRAGTRKRNSMVRESGTVWWQGTPITFRSEDYYALIERALLAKVEQNREVREALEQTGGAELMHETGREERADTSLPKEKFLEILTRIRANLQAQQR